jgi:benzoyl-CoA reductase/2-hydroxyglutaryl-CoA dehydratase subunit BcrC/BadD/HgdB
VVEGYGMHVVFDELPWEFTRLGGRNISSMARSYTGYTFARELEYRLELLEGELERRRVDGVIHYTQYACHHVLEDEVLRDRLDLPLLTVQGDLPRSCPAQERLRLEAFAELLRGGDG